MKYTIAIYHSTAMYRTKLISNTRQIYHSVPMYLNVS